VEAGLVVPVGFHLGFGADEPLHRVISVIALQEAVGSLILVDSCAVGASRFWRR